MREIMIDTERPASSLAIALFGPLDVRLQGRPLPTPRSQKTHWLLALLALQEGRAVDRAWLAGTLWPDSTEQQAAAYLRSSLWHLRQALGPEAHRLETPATGKLRLDLVGAEADVLVFDEAIARGDASSLERAVAVHRGPLLQGCVEEWVLPEREAREQAYLAALETLAAHEMGRGEPGSAARYLRRLVVADPLRDSAHRALMEALAATGDVAAASQIYREFRSRLHVELNAAPDAETTALYERIRAAARARADARRSTLDAQRPPQEGPHPLTSSEPSDESQASSVGSLPHPVTRLIGREEEVAGVRARLREARLVTLTGPGGIGKTRLAIQVAEEERAGWADGACLVDLAPLPGGSSERPDRERFSLLARTVARVLGVREQPNEPESTSLVKALRNLRLLLVLDNCEHLLDVCAALAETLLEGCPHLQILATSRQVLGLTGEVVWRVNPLSLPEASGIRRQALASAGNGTPRVGIAFDALRLTPDACLRSAAVRLFRERAVAAVPGFRVTEGNAAVVAEVCRRLDGIPLAIELAATRLRALSVEELAARLEDRFRLLTQGSRTALPRQQTLQATLDWSYGLLSERERTLLRRLSVFVGGWTLEPAEAVCASGASVECEVLHVEEDVRSPDSTLNTQHSTLFFKEADVLDLLASLVDKSLVVYDDPDGKGRYRLLETVRQYAHDRLREAGEEASVRGRHLSYFVRLVQEAEPGLRGGEQAVWLDRLEREHDNLHAAIEWSLEAEEAWQEGLALTRDLFIYWDLRHRFGEALGSLKRFAERSAELPLDEQANVFRLAGLMAMKQADYATARRYLEQSRALRRQLGEVEEDPRQLQGLAALALNEGDYTQGEALLQQSLRIFREWQEAGRDFEHNALGWTLDPLGGMAYCGGEFPSSRSYYEQSLSVFREAGDKTGIASAFLGLGRVAMRQGEYSSARALLQESLSLFEEVKAKRPTVEVLNSLVCIGWHERDFATARGYLVDALVLCRETERHRETVETLISAGHLAQRQDQPARAARLFAAAEVLRAAIKEPMPRAEQAEYEDAVGAARAELGEEAFAAAWAEGRPMTLEQAVALASEPEDAC
jgi:predicted ATPase/DNA-binding SARP family transcriptional activator